jgi:signal transduction histidine kinase
VLRHNLRNDLNLVGGYAERLCNRVDDDRLADHAARIRDTVGRMVSQSEAAREVQEAIRQERDHSERVDLVERVRAVVTEYRERYPDAGIETDLPETSHVAAGRRLDLVVRNLVENALVHNDGTEPTIAVRVERAPDRVCLTVEDDGPGIPDSERAVVAEDREITQLEHGSGLGLWVVKWLVENYGGGVEFVETDLGGAAVRVSFHRDPTG